MNDKLRKEVFDWSQRDGRIAEDMGFSTAEELRTAISERPHIFHKSFIEEAARNLENLEECVAEHIRLDATSSAGLADAAKEIDRLTKDNAQLVGEKDALTRERDELARRVKELEGIVSSRVPPSNPATGLLTPATTKRQYVILLYPRRAYMLTVSQPAIARRRRIPQPTRLATPPRVHAGPTHGHACDVAPPADGALTGRGVRPGDLTRGTARAARTVRGSAQGEGACGGEAPRGLPLVARVQELDVRREEGVALGYHGRRTHAQPRESYARAR